MTALSRLTTVLDALLDTTVSNQLKIDLADSFMKIYQEELINLGHDPNMLTNEQKAKFVLLKLRQFLKDIHTSSKVRTVQATITTALTDAEAAAITDIGSEGSL